MSSAEDPVLGRLDDALNRVEEMERRVNKGEVLPQSTLITELRAIRDDLLAERRDVLAKREELEYRMSNFLPRQPYQKISASVVGLIFTLLGGWLLWIITGRG